MNTTTTSMGNRLRDRIDALGLFSCMDFSGTGRIVINAQTFLERAKPLLDRMHFPMDDERAHDEIARINAQAFMGGMFGKGFDHKRARNRALSGACFSAFHLLDGLQGGRGMASVLPFHDMAAKRYLDGHVGDNDVDASMIAQSVPVMHVLFIIARGDGNDKSLLGDLVMSSFASLVVSMLRFQCDQTQLLAANSSPAFGRLFSAMGLQHCPDIKIADGEAVYCADVSLLSNATARLWLSEHFPDWAIMFKQMKKRKLGTDEAYIEREGVLRDMQRAHLKSHLQDEGRAQSLNVTEARFGDLSLPRETLID